MKRVQKQDSSMNSGRQLQGYSTALRVGEEERGDAYHTETAGGYDDPSLKNHAGKRKVYNNYSLCCARVLETYLAKRCRMTL